MKRVAVVLATTLLSSCIPDTPTAPPDAHLPAAFRDVQSAAPSLAAIPWQSFYDDPTLRDLIAQALIKNYTAQLGYQSVVAARESLNITHANELPGVSATVEAPYQTSAGNRPASTPNQAFAPQTSIGAS